MKTIFSFTAIGLAALLALGSCEKDNPQSPAAPTALSVADQTDASAVLSWEGTAPHYEVSVNGADPHTVAGNTHTAAELAAETTHTWRVRAKSGDLYSAWVDGPQFTTGSTALAAPTALAFSDVTYDAATLTWDGAAASYQVEVGEFTQTVDAKSLFVPGLDPETQYDWRVRAVAGELYGDWVDGPQFTTGALRVNADLANSYIVAPGGSVIVPVKQAYNAWADYFAKPIASDANLTAELVWMDTPGGSAEGAVSAIEMFKPEEGANAGIYVKAGNAEGNAVVALKAGDRTVWSWHIWVTAYDPAVQNITIDVPATEGMAGAPPWEAASHTLMDRNLGAVSTTPGDINSLGLTYQFGRKDPFPSSDGEIAPYDSRVISTYYRKIYDARGDELTCGWGGTGIDIGYQAYEDDMEGIAFAVENPNLFIAASSTPPLLIWTSNRTFTMRPPASFEVKMDMWGGNPSDVSDGNGWNPQASKTVFDPCPAGYRVPWDSRMALTLIESETENTVLPSQGCDFGQYGYFPFSGHIMPDGDAGFYQEVTFWGGFWMNWRGGYGGTMVVYDVDQGGIWKDIPQAQNVYPAYSASVRCQREW
ncbi:MAG: fibronectin type III domain-containing protein [Alistipes sp.]|jgi:hypothetical protein|nr:fibronectin type III domain-containing protein [Alistipes sp.]